MRKIDITKGRVAVLYNKYNGSARVFAKVSFKVQIALKLDVLKLFYKFVVLNIEDEFQTSLTDTELFQQTELLDMLNIVTVVSNEIVLVYKNGVLDRVLKKGTYKFWKANKSLTFKKYNTNDMDELSKHEDLDTTEDLLKSEIREFIVFSYEKAILLQDDTFVNVLNAGIYRYWKNPVSIKYSKVDIRQKQVEISGQELLTKDKATIRINMNAFYKVTNVVKALIDNQNYDNQLYTLLQLALRSYVSKYTLDELLEGKEEAATTILASISEKAELLGVTMIDVGIKDIILTGEMRAIMNKVLEAQKKSQANVITRREETAAIRSMLNTAKLMEDNEMLLKMKEMEYVEKIADKVGEISINGNGNLVKQLKEILA